MMKSFLTKGAALAALFVLGFAIQTNDALAAEKAYVSIATGGTAGTYYPIGGAIAKAVSTNADIQATAETGNASVANINLVGTEEIEVAFVQNDISFWAYNGQLMFDGKAKKNIRAICALYPEHVQLIATKDSGIKGLADLKGKRVSVGAMGSGVEGDIQAIFKMVGLTYDDIKVNFLDFGATTNRFKDNQIDAGFVVAGYPTASVMDLALTKDIDLVDFDLDFMKKMQAEYPFLVPSIIPAGTYNKIDRDVQTPAVMALLVTYENMPEDVIYNFTKSLYENLDLIQNAHAKAKEITLDKALDGITVPMHPGAAKYFQEKGMQVK
ncbi:TAXI family TRAP transporter solute-binding subunit [Desulfovibrio sp. OttesenSCG-928-C06]|nr:TAXI family TRAP transporter solute-binding subunit [Desulfovibrio sp. OttesenSCG-928-C06]